MTLKQRVGVVAAGPGQLRPIPSFSTECLGILAVRHRLVQVTHGVGEKAQEAVGG